MSRRLLWGSAALALCLGLFASWFVTTFERVSVPRREAPQAGARQNRYLALERFLSRVGRPVTRTTDADILHRLPTNGAVILDRGRAYHLTGARQDALMQWVDRGGYLILVPETADTPDALADLFDLVWTDTLRKSEDDSEPPIQLDVEAPGLEQLPVNIPGARPLAVAFEEGLTPTGKAPEWTATDPTHGAHVLHFAYGQGSVTVVAHLDTLVSNDRIGDDDHAELVSTLLERYQPGGAVVLLTRLDIPSLGQWLLARAPLVLASVTTLLALWLWCVVPRFGSTVPEPAQERREIQEHLLAVGRFVRARGGGDTWLTVVRATIHGRLARRHPYDQPGGDTMSALAVHTGIPAPDLTHAMTGDGSRADRFVVMMRALQRMERSL